MKSQGCLFFRSTPPLPGEKKENWTLHNLFTLIQRKKNIKYRTAVYLKPDS